MCRHSSDLNRVQLAQAKLDQAMEASVRLVIFRNNHNPNPNPQPPDTRSSAAVGERALWELLLLPERCSGGRAEPTLPARRRGRAVLLRAAGRAAAATPITTLCAIHT